MRYLFFVFFIISLCFSKIVLAQAVTCAVFLKELNQTEAPYNQVTDEGVHELRAPFWFNIRKLKDIDVKNNLYTVDYKFRVLYLDPNLKYLAEKLGLNNGFYCPFSYSDIADRYKSLDFYTTSIEDLKTTNDTINFSYVDGDFFIVRLIEKISLFSATTTRDFRQFPFDEHKLDIRIYAKDLFLNDMVSSVQSEVPVNLKLTTNFEMSQDPTEWLNAQLIGWKLANYEVVFDEFEEVVIAEIDLHRQPFFYLIKIIFPVVLVVLISWSVFLIHPRAIEARVNVTIVCLLALIAYNFVIEDALPKVPYLTFIDAVILSSYLFAGFATIYSIYSYRRFVATVGDNIRLGRADLIFRNISLPCYAMCIIFLALIALR